MKLSLPFPLIPFTPCLFLPHQMLFQTFIWEQLIVPWYCTLYAEIQIEQVLHNCLKPEAGALGKLPNIA